MNKKSYISPIDLKGVRTYPLEERKNKVKVCDFASFPSVGSSISDFINGLPKILVGNDFRSLVSAIVSAHLDGRSVILMLGGHVIKCGLAPVLISLMRSGIVTGIAMNGACSIHDFEIGLIGGTSEDVGDSIETGMFGMWEETGSLINGAINAGYGSGLGMGYLLGRSLVELSASYLDYSILASSYSLGIPLTVHVAIGTDIVHQHPSASGSAIGESSFIDFRLFCSLVSGLEGGVIINIGSAVILPEVFLKSLSIVRNLGYDVSKFVSANFDMVQHYRPRENVVRRPVSLGGVGYSITGHHEIMIPLLAHAVIDEMQKMT